MTSGYDTGRTERPDKLQRPGERKPGRFDHLFCEDTDASIGDLAKVLILKQLLSIENSSLAAILKKLATIDVSNDLIVKAVRSLEDFKLDHKATAEALVRIEAALAVNATPDWVARIEAKLAEIAGKLEATQAAARDLALGLGNSRNELSASVRAQSTTP